MTQFTESARRLAFESVRLRDAAIIEWSRQAGLTPEEWLKAYQPRVELLPPDPTSDAFEVRLRVTAVAGPVLLQFP